MREVFINSKKPKIVMMPEKMAKQFMNSVMDFDLFKGLKIEDLSGLCPSELMSSSVLDRYTTQKRDSFRTPIPQDVLILINADAFNLIIHDLRNWIMDEPMIVMVNKSSEIVSKKNEILEYQRSFGGVFAIMDDDEDPCETLCILTRASNGTISARGVYSTRTVSSACEAAGMETTVTKEEKAEYVRDIHAEIGCLGRC